MDKASELDRKLDEIIEFVKTCDKASHPEHWAAVERYLNRAAFISFNFDRSIECLEQQLDRREKSVAEFDDLLAAAVASAKMEE